MPDAEILKHSVTKDDYTDDAGKSGAVMNFWIAPSYATMSGIPPRPPAYWSFARDDVLAQTIFYESMWSSAIFIAITKMSSMSWRTKGLSLRSRKARELLLDADAGKGWTSFMQRHLRDFLLRDNGAFIEIVRGSRAPGSRIMGLIHLDSRRCQRTGDPDIPVIYRDRMDRLHEMKSHQVLMLSDMPDSGDLWYGVGQSSASRAYSAIYKLATLENYVTEKLSGRRPLAIHFVNNVSAAQVENAIANAENNVAAKGYAQYMGAVIVPNIDPTTTPDVATVDLAGLLENYDPDVERRTAYLSYANAIGLDPQELDPQLLASQALGTGAQARVIDDKASGKGLVAWRQDFMHQINEYIVPESVTFMFVERDYRDQLQQAELEAKRTDINASRISAGMITPEMATQLLVDVDDLPAEFLPFGDITPVEEHGDDINPRPDDVKVGQAVSISNEDGEGESGLMPRDSYAPADRTQVISKSPKPAKKEYEIVGEGELLTWEDITQRGWLSRTKESVAVT